jgi:hypothetical protein
MLQLLEARQEPDTRKARRWFDTAASPATLEDWERRHPPGSEGDRYYRMVVGHWQLVAVFWKNGYLPSEMVFASTREFRRVWERCAGLTEQKRAAGLGPRYLAELEDLCDTFDRWLAEQG